MAFQFNEIDHKMMARALDLAKKGLYSTHPNPRVGCVIAHNDRIIAEGFHEKKGGPHAEIVALNNAKEKTKGATAYVTLEPCSHFGSTPPCADALIKAGIRRVVAATQDPNPSVSGQGFERLRQNGIDTSWGLMAEDARDINQGFLSRFEKNRPFVQLKCATSLDGKTALKNGQSQWITGTDSRTDVQHHRAASSAILTGIGTVLADNPLLNVRSIPTERQPIRIILDSQLRTPTNYHIIRDTQSPTWIITTVTDSTRLQTYPQHIRLISLPASDSGQLALDHVMSLLAEEEINDLWVEAGNILNGALIKGKWVDELIVYQAPVILGHLARDAFYLPEFTALDQASYWKRHSSHIIGDDIKMVFRTI